MKFGRILVLSLATLLVAVPAVHAQDDLGDMTTKRPAKRQQTVEEENNDPTRPGPILGIGAVFAVDNFHHQPLKTKNSGGFNLHVGYRHNAYLATDVEVERDQKFNGHVGGVDVGGINAWSLGINERFYPIGGRIQPYAVVGLNYLKAETTNSTAANPNKTDDGPAMRFGIGLDVYATNKVVVTSDVSYMLGMSDVHNYDIIAISLGLAFRP